MTKRFPDTRINSDIFGLVPLFHLELWLSQLISTLSERLEWNEAVRIGSLLSNLSVSDVNG